MRVAETHSLLSGDLSASVVIQKVVCSNARVEKLSDINIGIQSGQYHLWPECESGAVENLYKSFLSFHSVGPGDWTLSQGSLPTNPSSWLPFL